MLILCHIEKFGNVAIYKTNLNLSVEIIFCETFCQIRLFLIQPLLSWQQILVAKLLSEISDMTRLTSLQKRWGETRPDFSRHDTTLLWVFLVFRVSSLKSSCHGDEVKCLHHTQIFYPFSLISSPANLNFDIYGHQSL